MSICFGNFIGKSLITPFPSLLCNYKIVERAHRCDLSYLYRGHNLNSIAINITSYYLAINVKANHLAYKTLSVKRIRKILMADIKNSHSIYVYYIVDS